MENEIHRRLLSLMEVITKMQLVQAKQTEIIMELTMQIEELKRNNATGVGNG